MKRNPSPFSCPVHISIRHPAVVHGMPICHDAHGKLMSAKDGIRAIRRWLAWKVESVAECCGVSVGTVRLWEHKGKQGLPVPAYALIALMLACEQEQARRIDSGEHYEPEPLPAIGKGRYKAMIRAMRDKSKSEPHEKTT